MSKKKKKPEWIPDEIDTLFFQFAALAEDGYHIWKLSEEVGAELEISTDTAYKHFTRHLKSIPECASAWWELWNKRIEYNLPGIIESQIKIAIKGDLDGKGQTAAAKLLLQLIGELKELHEHSGSIALRSQIEGRQEAMAAKMETVKSSSKGGVRKKSKRK